MTKNKLSIQIDQLLDGLDSQEQVAEATQLLHTRFFEKSLSAELDTHLGYGKHGSKTHSNSRNGTMPKTVYTDDGPLDV